MTCGFSTSFCWDSSTRKSDDVYDTDADYILVILFMFPFFIPIFPSSLGKTYRLFALLVFELGE